MKLYHPIFLTFALVAYSPCLHAQSSGTAEATVTYLKPPSRKMPADFKTFDIQSQAGFRLFPFKITEEQLVGFIKLPAVKPVKTGGDLHLSIIIGNEAGPVVHDGSFNNNAIQSFTASIHAPVYYKLTDTKGMIYEEDSSTLSDVNRYSTIVGAGSYAPAIGATMLRDEHTRAALADNIDWISSSLNEKFWGVEKHVPAKFYYIGKWSKYELDNQDRPVADSMIKALAQFSQDKQWPALQAYTTQAITFWQAMLVHLDKIAETHDNGRGRYVISELRY